MSSLTSDSNPTQLSFDQLAAKFRPIFSRIAEGAVEREAKRILPYQAVEWLREAGFGAVRIPLEYGGGGATIPQFFKLLTELGEADSNVSHLFRGHFAFLEQRINSPDKAAKQWWFPKIVEGALIGYAMAEKSDTTSNTLQLVAEGDHYTLNGTKYYSTGTLYADWIVASAVEGEERLAVAVPTRAPGVTRIDDWDGFGQRLTGSGTTKFENVILYPEHIVRRFNPNDMEMGYNLAFLQLILLATIAGVGRAALRDTVKFVQGRTRTFGLMGQTSPRNEPLVQRVVGRISSISFAADSIVNNLAQILEEAHQTHQAGHATQATFVDTQIRAYQAQQMVIDLILQETSQLFEVGGASATSTELGLDRHWRNARTAASHNPAIYRERVVGDFLLNGTIPESNWGKPIKAKTARSEEKPFEETPQEEQPNEPLATVGECSNRR